MSSPTPPVADQVPFSGTVGDGCADVRSTPSPAERFEPGEIASSTTGLAIPSPHFPIAAGSLATASQNVDIAEGDLAAKPNSGDLASPEIAQGRGPDFNGSSLRPDSPHESAAGDSARVEPSTSLDSVSTGERDNPAESETPRSLQHDQLAWYLSEQYLELDRREQLLQTQLAQFENERRQFRLVAGQRELELAEREEAVERERAELDQRQQQVTATEASQHDLQVVLLRERRDLQEEREQFAREQEAIRAELAEEVQATHTRLERERDEAAADIAVIREELRRDQQLSESRLRFREEHLQRTMREFEQHQHEFRVEQQQGRTRLAETESQLLLRRRQLAGIRAGLEAHAASLERDRQWLQLERRGVEARLQQDRERLRAEQHDWNVVRAEHQSEVERRQQQLREHASALETRRQQLEALRREVEQTHGEALELRLAVEEAYAQLTRTVGEETTFERVEQARLLLVEHYRNSRDTLAIERQELEQLQGRLAGERSDLIFERQALAEWVTAQEQLLARRTAELDHDQAALQNREVEWRQAEDRWHNERQQAETIIRELLRQRDEIFGISAGQSGLT